MSEKLKAVFVCQSCGYENPKWYGRCPQCGEWDSLREELRSFGKASSEKAAVRSAKAVKLPLKLSEINTSGEERYLSNISEFDRVLGGGLVKGSLVLLSGDPGIGKSTLLLQLCEKFGRKLKILYVSGEESAHQIKLRAERLSAVTENLYILSETDTELITETTRQLRPDILIIDSIQTLVLSELTSAAGSITQVRESTNFLMRNAKELDIPVIIVGHVNKDGNIAGPKVLEHIVDAVLYFEGDRNFSYRILRAVKNRFGSVNEIGVFEMTDGGLREVENPSLMMLSGRPENSSGSCVACIREGTRPILAEVQALVSKTAFGNPRRMCSGFDYNRINMILAVLEKRCSLCFSDKDVYLNVIGGLRLSEPASDLSAAIALISGLKDIAVGERVVAFGEIGLAGEIRSVNGCESRLREAARLGFERAVIPYGNLRSIKSSLYPELEIIGAKNIGSALKAALKAP